MQNSLIFFFGTLVLSIFNYLYNSYMGRLLGPASYSVIGSLLAFISIVTIPTNAAATATMRFTANYHARGQDGNIHGFFRSFTRLLLMISIVAALLLIALSPWLANYLHLPSITPLIIIAPLLIFATLLPITRGILQGLQQFKQSIINQSFDPILKLLLGILFVNLGFGINGAIVALVIGAAVAYFAGYWPLKPILATPMVKLDGMPKEVKDFSAIALVAFLLATLLMNVDILLVKHYFSAHDAGLYTALSTMGKIILFVTSPIVSVMFPMIADLQGRDEKHYRVLLQSIIIVVLIGLCGVVGYYLLPTFVVTLLYGQNYLAISPYLGLFGIVMLLYSLINLWINYFLSIGDRVFVWFVGISAAAEVILLTLRHKDFMAVIVDLLVAMVLGFILLTGYYLYLKRTQLTSLLEHRGFSAPMS